MSCEYVKSYYGVPAQVGRRVTIEGKRGIIAEDRGHYIGVNFDEDPPGIISNAHPTWKVIYGCMGKIRKMTRSQARYQDYLRHADLYDSFSEYLGIRA